jgi:sterol desaturase/sphingolipid hydroxylase (fatty acid hydroxylase superfamily)
VIEATKHEFRLGEGKLSGSISAGLGVLGLGAVLCLLFPSLLTTPDMRALYPMAWVRALIQTVLVLAFGLGILSVMLSRARGASRVTGFIGTGAAAIAMLLGGAHVEVVTPVASSSYIGLDWFVFNLFFLALIFVPLERVFARLPEQKVFRPGWQTDVAHFFTSHVLVQATVLLTMLPAAVFFGWSVREGFQARVAAQPLGLQFVEALFLADLFAYFSHRLFHRVPLLWRFHAIHHSSDALDWLASSRLHLVDIVLTRAVGFVPLYLMGFAPAALYAYLVFASLWAILIHSNVRFDFAGLRHVIVTPQFHHWHHTAERHALDKNFAVHLPFIDRVFGTHYLPGDRWPDRYGIEDSPVPSHYLGQLVHPFVPSQRVAPPAD